MKFLVCFDNNEHSEHIVKEAQKHAKIWNAELEIARVLMRETPYEHSKLLEIEAQLETDTRKLFEDVDIPYQVKLVVDNVQIGEVITDMAKREKVDLIFLGLKKLSKVGKFLFGSNAQYIILRAPCPVVSVTRLAIDKA